MNQTSARSSAAYTVKLRKRRKAQKHTYLALGENSGDFQILRAPETALSAINLRLVKRSAADFSESLIETSRELRDVRIAFWVSLYYTISWRV